MKKRILSLVLAILMVVSCFPENAIAVGEETASESESVIGREVKFTSSYPWLWTDPYNVSSQVQGTASKLPEVMKIIAVHQYSQSTTLYQLDAAVGVWPADYPVVGFEGKYWIESTKVSIRCDKCGEFGCGLSHENWCDICSKDDCGIDHEPSAEGECIITDANGNVIDPSAGVSFVQYSKLELNAQSALEGTVSYQWQIEYEEGKWVDIYGEDSRTVNLSYGMVASLLNDDGMVNIRCRSTSGSAVSYSAIIPVTMEMYTLEKPDVVVTESCVTSSGETVYVTLAGMLPEDGFVTMEETDADDVEVRPTETVVAALDISVLNLNGTPWQPEYGETVTVTLEASKLGMNDGQRYVVYHQHNGVVTALGAYDVADGIIKFVVDGFSKFVFTELEMLTTTEDLQADVTKKATINDERYTNLWLVKSPETVTAYTGQWYVQADEGVDYAKGIKFKISGAYVSSVYPYGVFYKVEAVNSEELLTDKLQENPWVFQRYQDEPVEDGTLILQESEGPELPEIPEAPDFSSHIGKHAQLTQSDSVFTLVLDEEPSADNIDNSTVYMITDFSTDFTLKIDGYKVIAKIDAVTSAETGEMINYLVTQSLWYKVSVVKGSSSKEFEDGWWVYQGYIINGDVLDGAFTLFDAPVDPEDPTDPSEPTDPTDPSEPTEPEEPSVGVTVDGQPVQEITVSTSEKVTLTATPNVEGTTTYQWQILISAANMWVNIANQNTAECVINYGMVANRLDAEGKAYIRCVTKVDGTEIIGEPIAVLIGEVSEDEVSQVSSSSSSSDSAQEDGSADNTGARANTSGAADVTEYLVTVYYYVGDSTVMHREVLTMEFGVNEEAKTTSFPIPVREGYTAYYFGTNANTGIENGTEYTEAEYVLENFKPTSDMTLYVRYYPNDDTPYTVEYYVQNIDDDEYTLVRTEVREGTTDEYIPAFDQNYENGTLALNWESQGFYATPYKRDKVAASGNTVVKIYYERYMYLLMFDLGEGGMGVDPIYARVGVKYEVANEPTRRGYVFNGWQLENGTIISRDAKPYVFEIPADDTTVKAVWRESNTTYTVVYWKENADPDKDENGEIVRDTNGDPVYSYSYWTHDEVDSFTGNVVNGTNNIVAATDVTQTEAQYFTFNNVATDKNIVVKGNGSTVVNVYYLRNYYEIYFYARGTTNSLTECAVTPHTHGDGTCETYPICAQKEHEHDDSCTRLGLTCGTTLHTHTNACCTKTLHAEHTSACCNDTVHANHTTSCYNNVGNAYTGTRVDNVNPTGDGYIYRYNSNNRYIYINGRWYNYSGTGYTGNIAQTNANCPGIHTHGDGNCVYTDALHTHGDGTCTCNATEHREHTDACYEWECGTSVSHVHTDACYSACTKPVHTHSNSNCTDSYNNTTQYLLKIIRAKYDADISKEWPVANDSIPGLAGFAYWTGNGNDQSSRVVTMNSDWAKGAGGNAVEVNANYRTTKYQLNYWFEDPDQTAAPDSDTRKYNSDLKKYYVLNDKYSQTAYYGSTSTWNYKEITGMTRAYDTSASITNNTANLYYNRNRWNLYFESDNTRVYTENSIPFEKSLKYYLDADGKYITSIIPTTNPVDKPASGYYFEGWYTTGECIPGTKVDFNKLTMPNNDLTLFANWAPRTHRIEFYFDSSLSNKLDEAEFPTQLILHNEYGADPGLPAHPMEFEAVVWFYRDANGEEKSFDFGMPVTEDMKLYPKWRTNVYVNYEVRYKVYDQNSNQYTDIEIADRLYGEELYGELVTLSPKGTEEFYDEYKQLGNGYFPMSGSHSISMGETACSGNPPYTYCTWDEETSTHIFTFYYVNGPTVPYTVEYHEVDANGNFVKKLRNDKYVADNYYAKVVENAEIFPGYMPDAAQKTLYVVFEGENKIIFYYTIDEEASFYRVSHWVKKYGSNEYTLIQDPDDFASRVGDIISNYPPLTIPGVTYTHTEIDPADHTVGKTIDGKPGLTVDLYYEEESVTINYVVKGPSNCGTLSLYTETVGAYYGTAVGSQATPSSNVYKFVGWYSDEACTVPVTYDTTNNKFVPSKANGVHVAATYYAKFEYNLTSLTIKKVTTDKNGNVVDYSEIDPNQSFIFDIYDGTTLVATVTANSATGWKVVVDGLTVGKHYTVTERTDWSWRYICTGWGYKGDNGTVAGENATASITLGLNATVTFTNTRGNEQWLDGDSWCNNIFK